MLVLLFTDGSSLKEWGARPREAAREYAIERTSQMLLERYERLVMEAAGRKRGWQAWMANLIDGIIQ